MLAEVLEGGNSGHYSEKNRVKDESFGLRMWGADASDGNIMFSVEGGPSTSSG